MTTTTRFPARRCAVLACAAAVAAAGCASAPASRGRGGPPPGQEGAARAASPGARGPSVLPAGLLFAGFDADADMIVTLDEAEAGIARAWTLAGEPEGMRAVAFSDWAVAAMGTAEAQPAYVAFDNNLDGVVSRAEFTTRLEREFSVIDADGDGRLLRSEMLIPETVRPQEGPPRLDPVLEERGSPPADKAPRR